jgi:hypothetical protein
MHLSCACSNDLPSAPLQNTLPLRWSPDADPTYGFIVFRLYLPASGNFSTIALPKACTAARRWPSAASQPACLPGAQLSPPALLLPLAAGS